MVTPEVNGGTTRRMKKKKLLEGGGRRAGEYGYARDINETEWEGGAWGVD